MKRCGLTVPASTWGRRLVAAGIVLVTVGAVVSVILLRSWTVPADAAFKVGDTVVTKTELARRTQLLGALFGVRQPPDPAGQDAFRRDTAKAIATSTILDKAAADRGIVISDKTARDMLAKMVNEQLGGQSAYVQLLGQSGASETDVLDEIKRQLATQQLFTQVASPSVGEVTDDVVRSYYRDHPTEEVTPEQRHLRNIVVASEPEAADVLKRVSTGTDFGATAGQSTLDQSTRAAGGDLGFLPKQQLDPAYGDAAFRAPPNGLFGPVKTQSGWNVGQVLEVRPATQLSQVPFDKAVGSLGERLRSDRALATWRDWQAEQVTQAHVRYADEFRPADPNLAAAFASPPASPPAPAALPVSTGSAGDPISPSSMLVSYAIAAGLIGVGIWGRRNTADLIPPTVSLEEGAKRYRVLRRGTVTAIAGGVFVAALATVGLIFRIIG
jgi:peptidyl-prolyl cis-trans isomerase C